jgi:hypothetical protein
MPTMRPPAVIRATCHTADEARRVEFDASPWFAEADAASILLLAGQGWSAAWVADALEARPGYEELRELLRYARERLGPESREDPSWPTFECRVAGADAIAWLGQNRPDVAARLGQAP